MTSITSTYIDFDKTTIPTDPDEYAELVFAEATYKDRKTRDDEAAAE